MYLAMSLLLSPASTRPPASRIVRHDPRHQRVTAVSAPQPPLDPPVDLICSHADGSTRTVTPERHRPPGVEASGRIAYLGVMSSVRVPGGVVHEVPKDLRDALAGNPDALGPWKDITPLARNEFICWVEDAKQD